MTAGSGRPGSLSAALGFVVAIVAIGCSSGASTTPASGCAPGQVLSCVCSGGGQGQRICPSAGAPSVCICPDAGGPVAGEPNAADAAADGANDGAGGGANEEPACRPRACGGAVLCGAADDGCGGTLHCGPCYEKARSLILPARSLAADQGRRLLYATVAGDAARYPNTVVTIDPDEMKVTASVDVGSNPGALALADDGNTLWVAIDGALAIRRIDLSASPPTVSPQYPLPRTAWGDTASASSIVPLPGAPLTVAITLNVAGVSPSEGGVAILDDGRARKAQTDRFDSTRYLVAASGDTLFGVGGPLTIFTVTASGVSARSYDGLVDYGPLAFVDGRVFTSGGAVVDVSDVSKPVRLGRFSFSGTVFPERGKRRAFMFSVPSGLNNPAAFTMRWLDTDNFVQIVAKPIADLPGGGYPSSVCRLGPETFALINQNDFSTSSSRVVVVFETSVASPTDGGADGGN